MSGLPGKAVNPVTPYAIIGQHRNARAARRPRPLHARRGCCRSRARDRRAARSSRLGARSGRLALRYSSTCIQFRSRILMRHGSRLVERLLQLVRRGAELERSCRRPPRPASPRGPRRRGRPRPPPGAARAGRRLSTVSCFASSSSTPRVTPARIGSSSDGVKSVSPSRQKTFAVGASSDGAVVGHEQRVVGAAGDRGVLRAHVLGVAHRLRAREGAGRPADDGEPQPARAERSRAPGRSGLPSRRASFPSSTGGERGPSPSQAPTTSSASRSALRRVGRRQPDALGRGGEACEVPVEQERPAAVHADRLEDRAPAQQRLVVGGEHRLARVDQTRAGDCDGANVHQASASSGRAFTHDSSISSSASESQTMPPPTQRWIAPSTIANVRIVSARSRSPFA